MLEVQNNGSLSSSVPTFLLTLLPSAGQEMMTGTGSSLSCSATISRAGECHMLLSNVHHRTGPALTPEHSPWAFSSPREGPPAQPVLPASLQPLGCSTDWGERLG